MEREEALIKRHEGFSGRVYIDTVGVPTVGWGHALHEGSPFPESASRILFDADYHKAKMAVAGLAADGLIPSDLDGVRRAVLVNMAFNLGGAGLRKFKGTLGAVKRRDFTAAAGGMRASLWAKQVGRRAAELCAMMETGQWPAYLNQPV